MSASKTGHQFVLDRTNGKPVIAVEERPVFYDTRSNAWPTQPRPATGAFNRAVRRVPEPGFGCSRLPHRAVPNWNGYQAQPDPANPGQLQLVVRTPNYLDADIPFRAGPPRLGCIERG